MSLLLTWGPKVSNIWSAIITMHDLDCAYTCKRQWNHFINETIINPFLYASYAAPSCMRVMQLLRVCELCSSFVYASYAAPSCMRVIQLLRVCELCSSFLYASYPAPSGMRVMRLMKRANAKGKRLVFSFIFVYAWITWKTVWLNGYEGKKKYPEKNKYHLSIPVFSWWLCTPS